jgi:divalent metal cation (Fe/Co/Zn/Cd) transporter
VIVRIADSEIIHSYHHRLSPFSQAAASGSVSFSQLQGPSRAVTFDEESPLLRTDTQLVSLGSSSKVVDAAILVNFAANVFLLVAKFIVTLTSSSLSVLASLIDSVLDFLSTLIIFGVSRMIQHKDWKTSHQFPVGKARLEPIGVLVFSVIMIVSFMQVCVEAVQRLLKAEEDRQVIELSIQGIIIMSSTGCAFVPFVLMIVVVKFGCWLWSRSVQNSGVQALAQDAMNDVVFKCHSF